MSEPTKEERERLNIDAIVAEYGMTVKQAFFCEYYIQTLNGTKAAKLAGFAHPNVEGTRLLGYASVKRYLDKRFAEQTMRSNEVLARLTDIARSDIGDYLKVSSKDDIVTVNGKVLEGVYFDLAQAIKDGNTSRIKSYKRSAKDGTVIELHDAMKALELIGKHNRLFADVTIQSTKDDNTVDDLSDTELAKIAAQAKQIDATDDETTEQAPSDD